jgi:anaerobic ribonucleoside-triphosphate reductase activating protein
MLMQVRVEWVTPRSAPMKVRVHAVEEFSRANGPGWRAVVWFQGCTLGCVGCFNPLTHPHAGGQLLDTADLAARMACLADRIEGVTVSGGEPFQQPEALVDLLARLAQTPLSRLVFSGYTLREIAEMPLGPAALRHIDVLIGGRYVAGRHLGLGLLGSANQQAHLLTSRYCLENLADTPAGEVVLHPNGTASVTGIAPPAGEPPGLSRRG